MPLLTTARTAETFLRGRISKDAPTREVRLQLEERLLGVGEVVWLGVAQNTVHSFPRAGLTLRKGHGVVGDRRSGASKDPLARLLGKGVSVNLEHVLLLTQECAELLEECGTLAHKELIPGAQSENIRTKGLALEDLVLGTVLCFLSRDGEISPASLVVTGYWPHGLLPLTIQSSAGRQGSDIGHDFVAAFRGKA